MSLDIHKLAKSDMEDTVSALRSELQTIRAGRANPAILDKVLVDYYGQMTPINQTSNISAPEPMLLLVQPYDANMISAIEHGIIASDLGLNPVNDGKVIRINIPALTAERRQELTKMVAKYGEEAKVSVRNIRRDSNSELKKLEQNKELSEDELRKAEKEMQDITDEAIKHIDEVVEEKNEELTSI